MDKKQLVLDLVDLLAALTAPESSVIRSITEKEIKYLIKYKSGNTVLWIKSRENLN